MLHPPAYKTKELVHIFLLIGKTISHNKPCIPITIPDAIIKVNPFLSYSFFDDHCKNCPAKMPSRAEPIAGMVDSNPSGSYTVRCSLPGNNNPVNISR